MLTKEEREQLRLERLQDIQELEQCREKESIITEHLILANEYNQTDDTNVQDEILKRIRELKEEEQKMEMKDQINKFLEDYPGVLTLEIQTEGMSLLMHTDYKQVELNNDHISVWNQGSELCMDYPGDITVDLEGLHWSNRNGKYHLIHD